MNLQPFPALLPQPGYADQLRDVENPIEQLSLAARDHFQQLLASDRYFLDSAASFYPYAIRRPDGGTSLGVVMHVDLEEFAAGLIRPHEATLLATEAMHRQIIEERQALVKPVLLTFLTTPRLRAAIQQAHEEGENIISLQQDGETHLVSRLPATRELSDAIRAEIETLYVADGHHRLSTLYHLYRSTSEERYRYLSCALFSSDQLAIHGYHRLVQLPTELSAEELLLHLETYFNLTRTPDRHPPGIPGQWAVRLAGHWYRAACLLPTGNDVEWFNNTILPQLFGITDVRNDPRITYLPDNHTTITLERKAEEQSAALFCPYPIGYDNFFSLVGQGRILPPKSTYFTPRILSGLVVQRY